LGLIFLLGPLAVLAVFCLGVYWLGRPRGPRRGGKNAAKARSLTIRQVFEQQYRQGKITESQLEEILRRYSDQEK
jgi:hypothetical protein